MGNVVDFRVWDKDTKKMYEVAAINFITKDLWLKIDENKFMGTNLSKVELMQYTGFNDINNKKIYEGDIMKQIKVKDNYIDKNNYRVIFKYGSLWLEKPDGNTVFIKDFPSIDEFVGFECFETIGNIYENSDLLKEDKK